MGDTNAATPPSTPPSGAPPAYATDAGHMNAAAAKATDAGHMNAAAAKATDAGHMSTAAAKANVTATTALGGRIHAAGQDRCAANRRRSGEHDDHLAPH